MEKEDTVSTLSRLAGLLGLALILAACGTSAAPSSGASDGAPAASQDASAIIADLATKAKAEGALNSYGMPPDWTNFGAIWDKFLNAYGPAAGTPLTHTDTDMSSAEEIQKFDAEKNNPVADQGDIGIQF